MKKIHNPAAAARRALRAAQSGLKLLEASVADVVRAAVLLRGRKGKIVVTGVGKSAYIGMKLSATLTSLGEQAVFLHPVEALHGDLGLVRKGDVLIAISHSGESPEVVRIAEYVVGTSKVPLVAITGKETSSLGRLAQACIRTHVTAEGSPLDLAPMASTTAALTAGDMLAAALVDSGVFEEAHFARFHPGGSLGLRLKTVAEAMDRERVPLAEESMPLSKTIGIISDNKKGIAGIISRTRVLVGVVSDGDVRRFLTKHESIAGRTARAAMTRRPKTIAPDASLRTALACMEEYKITSLFVVDLKRRPIGIIHMHDILGGSIT